MNNPSPTVRNSQASAPIAPRRLPLSIAITAALAIASAASTSPADAAIRTWDGATGKSGWGKVINGKSNWTGSTSPSSGDSLVFAGMRGLYSVNDLSALSVNGISFAASAGEFQLEGQGLTSSGNIINGSGNRQGLHMPIKVAADQKWDGGGKGMLFRGAVDVGAVSLGLFNGVSIDTVGTDFTLGSHGQAALSIASGSHLAANVLTVSKGALTLQAGGSATATTLVIGSEGRVNLLDGGSLQVSGTFRNYDQNSLNWVKGSLGLSGAIQLSQLGGHNLTLDAGKTLDIADLTDSAGLTLGGLHTGAGTLTLDGGSLRVATASIGSGGSFKWLKGTLGLRGDTSLGSGLLAGPATTLADGMVLSLLGPIGAAAPWGGGALTIGSGKTLTLAGGSLELATGAIATGGAFNWLRGSLGYVGDASAGTGLLAGITTLDTGKTLTVGQNLTIGAGKTLTLDGGTMQVGSASIESGGSYQWIKGTLGFSADARLGEGLLAAAGTRSLGTGKTLLVHGTLDFGSSDLTLNGGKLELGRLNTGTRLFDWRTGSVSFTGGGSIGGDLLGKPTDRGNFRLATGQILTVADLLEVRAGNRLTLDGGSLQVGSGLLEPAKGGATAAGVFDWQRGSLSYSGDASLGSGLLASNTSLGAGKTLTVAHQLTIGSGTSLTLAGGQFAVKTVALNGGSIASTGKLDLSGAGTLLGHGRLAGSVSGGPANTIAAIGGTLSLGDVNANGGYAFGGTLNVGSQAVELLAADKAQLGVATNLGAGGQLSSVNGADLGAGKRLNFNGDSSVKGGFSNKGSVAGTAGTLSFLNDVNGAGSYAGNIVFKAGFKPGNSPAAVDFGGGDVCFDASSVLDIEIIGDNPGKQYDQLLSINTLSFEGTLNLVFRAGDVPLAGSSLALFDFDAFKGSFGTAADGYSKITVTGFDRSRLDFSQLAISGSLNVTAVPEPGSWALMLAGLLGVGGIARRRTVQTVG